MYSLDLREVRLDPPLTENRKFENEELYSVEKEAVEYITTSYGETYNPITVQRQVAKVIRDTEGKTSEERTEVEITALKKKMDEGVAASVAAADAVEAEYASRIQELSSWRDAENQKMRDEYTKRIEAAYDDGRKVLEEEYDRKLDDTELEYRKKYDALYNEKASKINEAWSS